MDSLQRRCDATPTMSLAINSLFGPIDPLFCKGRHHPITILHIQWHGFGKLVCHESCTINTLRPSVCALKERHVQKLRQDRHRAGGPKLEAYVQVNFPVRVHGASPLALRSDIQRLLADCNARLANIRCALPLGSGIRWTQRI